MRLSIIIINYKSEEFIERCLECIYFDREYEIIILDNEGNPELMKRLSGYPRVRIIPFEKNFGFAEGNNIAIRHARGEFICTLNADVFVSKNYLNRCSDFLDQNKEYSSVQGMLVFDKNKNCIDSTGNVITKIRYAYNLNQGKKISNTSTQSGEVFGVCAAAAVYRKEYLDQVKIASEYFDSDFFAYLEDVDLDWRLRSRGFKAFFLNDIAAYHIREASTGKFFRIKQAIRNRFFLIIKNDSWLSIIVNFFIFLPVFLLLPDRFENYVLLLEMFKKRKLISGMRKVANVEIFKLMKQTPWKRMILKLLTNK